MRRMAPWSMMILPGGNVGAIQIEVLEAAQAPSNDAGPASGDRGVMPLFKEVQSSLQGILPVNPGADRKD